MSRQLVSGIVAAVSGVGLLLAGCAGRPAQEAFQPERLKLPSDPADYAPVERFEAMKVPADNPITADKATLGWQLWFEKRLSGDGTRSCYSCHVNENGLTDGLVKNTSAFDGKPLARHTPTLWNIGYHAEWYWDGRAKTLEGQALAAWKLANMGAKDPKEDEIRDDVIARLNAVKGYRDQFQKVFGGPATETNVTQALATFMRTIVSRDTPYDGWMRGDEKAVSEAAKRGEKVFEKANCTNCHSGVFFTDQQFHNVGVGMKAEKPDVGRFAVTKIEKDTGAFKTPTLRDVVDSAPYFHDGSVATLEEAVKLMSGGGLDNPYLDRVNLQPVNLTGAEFEELIEFLKSLDEPTKIPEPRLPQ